MRKAQELLKNFDFTLDEFWAVIDDLPDEGEKKKDKDNIKSFFKKNGDLKSRALNLNVDKDFQDFHRTQGFIRRYVRTQIHMNRLRLHKDTHKRHIKDVREKKVKRQKVVKYGKLEPLKKDKDKDNGQ